MTSLHFCDFWKPQCSLKEVYHYHVQHKLKAFCFLISPPPLSDMFLFRRCPGCPHSPNAIFNGIQSSRSSNHQFNYNKQAQRRQARADGQKQLCINLFTLIYILRVCYCSTTKSEKSEKKRPKHLAQFTSCISIDCSNPGDFQSIIKWCTVLQFSHLDSPYGNNDHLQPHSFLLH